tara:strand:- start:274 stop:492 length:219 start_codon:yes stop_codon:yes gene_type:complete
MSDVWYVQGEFYFHPLWETKEDAEKYARYLFPDEDPDTRYARIYCREVTTWEKVDLDAIKESTGKFLKGGGF